MPLIEVKWMEETLPLPQKDEITDELTDATPSIEVEDMCTLGWTDLEEVPAEDWELGGLSMTTEAIRALIAGE
jgi:phenylpyruvate tautomerase PptA (4-oxalocrotonate tautomerase family)